ncbi:GntR family transcriptional regulator [Streptomyces sp. R302]|uniref:GntR family transcriptional regulator n=1 Tax=unclassified Streptomyces TaxID=2593676 RepID=UPI00145F38BD|nr:MULTISPECIES: GntR family transcriptional regulator [unclassified Streptomyces]NML52215.1 GntR family transcriptional regulator [Streptomyces sp. R301]NML82319.1 GntR family transcriptional regulator [Streptomyces sp. R302]
MPGTSANSAVTRSTLSRQIADALRDEVLAGRLQPGQEFTVKQIAEQYGVSATPVREALVDLCAQGLLDSDQHRGFRVHRFSVADYRQMVEARMLVADGLFRGHTPRARAALHEPDADIGVVLVSIRRRGEAAARAALAGDLDVLIGYDLRYWRELARLVSGNDPIADFLHRLRVQAWAFSVPHLRAERELHGWLWSGHIELIDAVTRGDADAAIGVVRGYNAHSLEWADRLEARLAR